MAGKGHGALPYAKVLRRSALLLILGLLLNGFPTFDLASLRLTGVLQRIAICYLFAALVFLHARLVTQICLIAGMLALYHVLMVVVPVPGCGAGSLTRECNLAGHTIACSWANACQWAAMIPKGHLEKSRWRGPREI